METMIIISKQLITMIIFMATGYTLFKKNMVTANGSKELSKILLYIILPCILIRSFAVTYSSDRLSKLLISFALSFGLLVVSMIISWLFFRKGRRIENFGVAFSNAGFMGIPLVKAMFGSEAVFYVASFVALLNVFQWTYGVVIMTGSFDAIKPQKIVKNPIVISVLIGMFLFLLKIPLPESISTAVNTMSEMNTPTAMMILGIFLAQTDILSMFKEKIIFICAFVRLLLIPLVSITLLSFVSNELYEIKMCITLAACAPIGSNVALFAQIHQLDYTKAVKEICFTTLFSVFTMPCMAALASYLWRV